MVDAVPEQIEPAQAASETEPAASPAPKKQNNGPISVAPKPVVFPVKHAPDDPGPEEPEDEGKKLKV